MALMHGLTVRVIGDFKAYKFNNILSKFEILRVEGDSMSTTNNTM